MRIRRGKIKLEPVSKEISSAVRTEIIRKKEDYNPLYGDFVKRRGYFEYLCGIYNERFGIILKRIGRTDEFYKGGSQEKITVKKITKELWGESASDVRTVKEEKRKMVIEKRKNNKKEEGNMEGKKKVAAKSICRKLIKSGLGEAEVKAKITEEYKAIGSTMTDDYIAKIVDSTYKAVCTE